MINGKKTTIYISLELDEILRKLAFNLRTSKSKIIVEALKKYIGDKNNGN